MPSLLRYTLSFFTASSSVYSLRTSIFEEAGGAYLSKQRGKFAEGLDLPGLKGYKRGRENLGTLVKLGKRIRAFRRGRF